MAEDRREAREIGRGGCRMVLRIACLDIFSSKIHKEPSHHISFEFSIGGAAHKSRLIERAQLAGEELPVRFSKAGLLDSDILVAVQQFRGIHAHNLGHFEIANG